MPVLSLGDSRLGDVDAHLTAVQCMHQLGEGAPCIHMHLQVVDGFLPWKITQVSSHEFIPQAAMRQLNHIDAIYIGGCPGTRLDDVHNLTEGCLMGNGYIAISSLLGGYRLYAIKLAAMLTSSQCANHLVH